MRGIKIKKNKNMEYIANRVVANATELKQYFQIPVKFLENT